MYDTTYPKPNELRAQPARSLVMRLFRDLSGLAEQEYALVRTELGQKGSGFARIGSLTTSAVIFGAIGAGAIALGAIAELAIYTGLPVAALFVGVVALAVAYVFGLNARAAMRIENFALKHASAQLLPKPRETEKSIEQQEIDIAYTRKRIDDTMTALEHKAHLLQPMRDTAAGIGALGVAVANIVREDGRDRN